MATPTPSRGSSLVLMIASLPILGLGLFLAPWAEGFLMSTRTSFSQSQQTAGEFAFGISSFLLFCGAAGLLYAIRDLIVGPSKPR